jgi:regulatory protein
VKAVDPTDTVAARQHAVAMLSRRDYASGELRVRLTDQGFEAGIVQALIAALEREHLLDDARFVEHYVSYHSGRGQGPARIGRDLKSIGLSSELIERYLGEGPDWVSLARAVRQKKFGRELPKSYAGKAKQARFLQYRGFTGAQIRQALGTDIDLDDT